MIWSGHSLRAYRSFLRAAFARVGERGGDGRGGARIKLGAVYLPRVAPARARLRGDARLAPLLSGGCGPGELLGSLLHLCAFGVRAGASAEWIRRAGHASAAAGGGLAAALAGAAQREAERGRSSLEDLFELGARARFDVELLLLQPPPRSLLRLIGLREAIAGGRRPGALLALELELATVRASLAPVLLDACARLDPDLRPSSLVADARAALGDRLAQLERALAGDPSLAEPFAAAGRAGLDAELDLLGDCVELGRELAARARITSPSPASSRLAAVRLALS